MLATAIAFSLIAATAVWIAGRRDEARDPRLTLMALALLAVFPLLFFLPEWQVLPHAEAGQPNSLDLGAWLPWIWGAGVLLFSTRLIAALTVLHRWRKNSRRIEAREAGDALVDI